MHLELSLHHHLVVQVQTNLTGTIPDARISASSVTQCTAFNDNAIINDISTLGVKSKCS